MIPVATYVRIRSGGREMKLLTIYRENYRGKSFGDILDMNRGAGLGLIFCAWASP